MPSSPVPGPIFSTGGAALLAAPALDANHVISWTFTGSSPWGNAGSGGALTMAASGTTYVTGAVTPWGAGIGFPFDTNSNYVSTPATSIGEGTAVTLEWVGVVYGYGDNFGKFISKYYRADDSWSTPFIGISLEVSADGTTYYNHASAGALVNPNYNNPVPPRWIPLHIAFTADSSTKKVYINGRRVVSASGSTIDWGTHGRWVAGSRGPNSANAERGGNYIIYSIRVSNVARSESAIAAAARTWLGFPS